MNLHSARQGFLDVFSREGLRTPNAQISPGRERGLEETRTVQLAFVSDRRVERIDKQTDRDAERETHSCILSQRPRERERQRAGVLET